MSDAEIIPLRRMTEAQYDAERAKLAPTRTLAGVIWEQKLALLFYQSGWTQEELAKREGKSRTWIVFKLRFGRFMSFVTMVTKHDVVPLNLTERKFREYWERTDKFDGDERQRFAAVTKLMQEEIRLRGFNRKKIGAAIKEKFSDGKWHMLDTIATEVGEDVDHVASTLDTMRKLETYGCKCEARKYGTSMQYRIFRLEKTISSHELVEKLAPLIKELMIQGKCNMATMSPPSVAVLAGRLQKLLDEWAE